MTWKCRSVAAQNRAFCETPPRYAPSSKALRTETALSRRCFKTALVERGAAQTMRPTGFTRAPVRLPIPHPPKPNPMNPAQTPNDHNIILAVARPDRSFLRNKTAQTRRKCPLFHALFLWRCGQPAMKTFAQRCDASPHALLLIHRPWGRQFLSPLKRSVGLPKKNGSQTRSVLGEPETANPAAQAAELGFTECRGGRFDQAARRPPNRTNCRPNRTRNGLRLTAACRRPPRPANARPPCRQG